MGCMRQRERQREKDRETDRDRDGVTDRRHLYFKENAILPSMYYA
jgi:hypothetical protein